MAPFPVSSLTLEYFCIQASQQVSNKTLKVYLSGIRLAHTEWGLPDPTDSPSLHLVCRGIRHQQGDSQRTRLPLTINILQLLKKQLRFCTRYTLMEKRLLWAVFTLGSSELVSSCQTHLVTHYSVFKSDVHHSVSVKNGSI